MGQNFTDLSWDDLCDLMCGNPEDDGMDKQTALERLKQLVKDYETLASKQEFGDDVIIHLPIDKTDIESIRYAIAFLN